jgi:hypothetical protein
MAKNFKYCPECKEILSNQSGCDICSWRNPLQVNTQKFQDKRCQYSYQDQRCENMGVMSLNLHGGGPWYCCRAHLENNPSIKPVINDLVDWREKYQQNFHKDHGIDFVPKTLEDKKDFTNYLYDCIKTIYHSNKEA